MRSVTTIIIGAGQAGLAMSRALTRRNVDHLILDRGGVATSWRNHRWDSLRMLTPNWANTLPGDPYRGPDPHDYMRIPELVARMEHYAERISAPVQTETEVLRVGGDETGLKLETSQGPLRARAVVMATGACACPHVPALAAAVPPRIVQTTASAYKRPGDLPDGGVLVVGASASGVQLAHELQMSGRQVTLAVGWCTRLPRNYRGRDVEWWLEATGVLDERYDEVDDLERARRTPSPQLIGGPEPVDLNALQDRRVEIVGQLAQIRDGQALFSGGLGNVCASADLKMNRLLDAIDEWIVERGLKAAAPDRPEPTRLPNAPALRRSLTDGGIRSILWATGYRPDFSWLDMPVFDARGRLRHRGGVVSSPGLYVMGLPFLRRRKSHQISGVGGDADELCAHLRAYLDGGACMAA
ncbi:MAG: NAD(P)-binding domain-containing protein [Methyloceanibacter sp.]|nr:NAD(P)-binding domain-containing protein [Methyloceanibacter sp.]